APACRARTPQSFLDPVWWWPAYVSGRPIRRTPDESGAAPPPATLLLERAGRVPDACAAVPYFETDGWASGTAVLDAMTAGRLWDDGIRKRDDGEPRRQIKAFGRPTVGLFCPPLACSRALSDKRRSIAAASHNEHC